MKKIPIILKEFKKSRLLLAMIIFMCLFAGSCKDDKDEDVTTPDLPEASFVMTQTKQIKCFNDLGELSSCPSEGQPFHGQDYTYSSGATLSYRDNGDGTVTDLNTGLMWQQATLDKVTWEEAVSGAETFDLAGYTDWRLPTIKELFSLIHFDAYLGQSEETCKPYVDTDYFEVGFGDADAGERLLDAQYLSSNEYVNLTMEGEHAVFGVNFIDGRIKGYGTTYPDSGNPKYFFVWYVRGTEAFTNDFVDNGDNTVTDNATGLMWTKFDSGTYDGTAGTQGDGRMDWEESLKWCEDLVHAGYSNWRMPNAKELQSILDYSRAPKDAAGSVAAIDPTFNISVGLDSPNGEYPYHWASTTHPDGAGDISAPFPAGSLGITVAFGQAQGMLGGVLLDVHGAGAVRSGIKSAYDGNDYPMQGGGPSGDIEYVYNWTFAVRDAN